MHTEDYDIVKADFDEIAELPNPQKWNHNNCYFNYLLSFVPEKIEICLDIGCGHGELSAMLCDRADRVIGVDLSDRMIHYAKKLHQKPNAEYICGNILDMEFEDSSLDLIITTATAHHLPYEWLLQFAKSKLKPDGSLIILDLIEAESLPEKIMWSFAAVPNVIMNIIKNGSIKKDDPHSAEVWRKHGAHDKYMTFTELKAAADKYLPNAYLRRMLFWRYVLVWKKQ